ncbi:MAG TPA: hypothetical protein VFN88_13165, partial [Caulobacteraceae bacterium]|nr:hypothetical protein [Caulobacteraceae bacterium]
MRGEGRVRVRIGYRHRQAFELFHRRRARLACVVAHRRAGKTVAAVCHLIHRALKNRRPAPRYGYIAPLLVQAKDVAWGYLKRYTAKIPGVVVREGELSVELPNGARIRLYGADNPDRLRGLYFDGVVLDEFADFAPGAWTQVIRPTLSDRNGFAAFIGTPKGKNEFWRMYERSKVEEGWYSLELKASTSKIL